MICVKIIWVRNVTFAHTSNLLTSSDQGRKWFIWFMSHSSIDWWCKFQLINKLRQILALVWGASGGNVLRTSFPSIFDVSIILAGSCWCLYASDTHAHTYINTSLSFTHTVSYTLVFTRTHLTDVMWGAEVPSQQKETMNHPPCVNVFHHS